MTATRARGRTASDGVLLASEIMTKTKAVAELASAQADQMEIEASVSRPVFDATNSAGLYGIMLPMEVGGSGADFATVAESIEEMARADGSTGWAYMVNVTMAGSVQANCSAAMVDALFKADPRPVLAGQLPPVGKAVRVDGGYRVTGRYSFASGSTYANWIGGGAVVTDGIDGSESSSGTIIFFVPKVEATMKGNWNVMGLNGTGSYDYEIVDKYVPDAMTSDGAMLSFASSSRAMRGTAYQKLGMFGVGLSGHCAVIIGIGRRAMEEVVRIANSKVRIGANETVAENAVFCDDFARNEILLRAARGVFYDTFRHAEANAERLGYITHGDAARLRQTTIWLHDIIDGVVKFCHRWSGTGIIRHPSVLGRCTRDMAVATQHIVADPGAMSACAIPIFDEWLKHPDGVFLP